MAVAEGNLQTEPGLQAGWYFSRSMTFKTARRGGDKTARRGGDKTARRGGDKKPGRGGNKKPGRGGDIKPGRGGGVSLMCDPAPLGHKK